MRSRPAADSAGVRGGRRPAPAPAASVRASATPPAGDGRRVAPPVIPFDRADVEAIRRSSSPEGGTSAVSEPDADEPLSASLALVSADRITPTRLSWQA